ncbi:hypothetical protein EDD99_0604 [Streptomyces sp. 846.5]|nr:hypothetical protein [Streptomyces sp. 846.5]TDU02215.1 hypothetical protein EDD99_0604 [Streptomyces sp. 846.5]
MSSAVRRFTAYRILSRSYFHLTILFVFFYDRGLSLPGVEAVLAVYGATLALAGPVVRPVAARLSLTAAVSLGEVLKAVGLLLLAAPGGIPVAVVAQVVAALGFSLASGTDSALLAEICRRDGEDARAWESRSGSLTFIAALVAGVAGAVLYQASHNGPFVLSAVMSALAAAMAVSAGRGLDRGSASAAPRPAGAAPAADGRAGGNPHAGALRRWAAFYTIVRGFVLALFIGFLPYLLYVRLHAALPVFGLILGSYTLSGYFSARYAKLLTERVGARGTALAAIVLTGAGLLILLWQENVAGAAVATVALGLGVGGVRPMVVGAVNDILADRPATERAAALRANEARFAAFNTVLILLAGLALDRIPFSHLLAGLALGYLLVAGLVLATLPRGNDAAAEPAAAPAPAATAR